MNKAQKSWLLFDPAISAFAMIVRTVVAPIYLAFYAENILTDAQCSAYWGYAGSFAGIIAGSISICLGPRIDARRKKVPMVAFFTVTGIISALAYIVLPGAVSPALLPYAILLVSFTGIFSFMGANSFYDSLLLDITTPEERNRISSTGYALGYAGGLLSFLLCLPFLKIAGGKYFFTASFLIAAVWWGLGSLPLFCNVRQKAAASATATMEIKLKDSLKFIISQKNILLFLIAYFLYIDGVGTIMMQATLIAKGLHISNGNIMMTILALQIIGLPCTLLFGRLADKFSAKRMISSAIFIYMFIAVIVTVMSFNRELLIRQILFYLAAALIGTVQGGIQSLSRSLFSRIIPPERAAELFAVYNLFGKFTTIVGPLFLIPLAVFLWDRAELGITLLLIPFALGAILLTKVKVPEN
ncbi:MAG: MFS transporter [Lentisphaeria bacterium]|nr:MFS transporter [Lentisphaeria bacterium]